MTALALIVFAYLTGSLSFAVIVSRACGLPDPHEYGSGNPGATNVLRTGNKSAALATLVGDAGKGYAALAIAHLVLARYEPSHADAHDWILAAVALAVFAGHLWPVFFGFRGGKGVATAGGILLGVDAWLGAATIAVWLAAAGASRISSLGAIAAALSAPLWYWWLRGTDAVLWAIVALALLLLWRHKENIRRLLAGREGRMGRGVRRNEA